MSAARRYQQLHDCSRSKTLRRGNSPAAVTALFATMLCVTAPARAADGCLVMLCLAAPNWKTIRQCVDPVRQVLRDLARGRPFPSCGMSGAGNSANHRWSSPPTYCPPQYTRVYDIDPQPIFTCDYDGAVEVAIDGCLWTRTWWNWSGDTVTEYAPVAKAALGTWDTRFDDDYSTWLAALPAAAPSCSPC